MEEKSETSNLRPWRKKTLQIISTEKFKPTPELAPLPQVAGHGSSDKSQAILTNKNGWILKPIQPGPRGERELGFYQEVNDTSASPEVAEFLSYIPQFFGTCNKNGGEYMMIENLIGSMKKPCIMDIKVGAKTYGPDASEAKKVQQDAKFSGTKIPFGFSVLGMSVYQGENKEEVLVKSKDYGKGLNEENITEFVNNYFDKDNATSKTHILLENIIEKLEKIQELFAKQTSFHIFASSILFVYDAAALIDEEGSEEDIKDGNVVKMIDFAHPFPGNGEIDENYLKGVNNLLKIVKEFKESI